MVISLFWSKISAAGSTSLFVLLWWTIKIYSLMVITIIGIIISIKYLRVDITSGTCIICLYTLCLEIFYYFSWDMMENLIYIKTVFSTCFKKWHSVLFSKCESTFWIYFFICLWHISLIGNQNFFNIWNSVLINLCKPVWDIIESAFFGAIVY